ncbi:MAG: ABC transporter permease [Nitratireductor sp.]
MRDVTQKKSKIASRLSPLNQRRLENFKANKRGLWSLRIFLTLFFITLFAEFIANDRPIFIWFEGKAHSPVLVDYSEDAWLGEDPLNLPVTDYKLDLITEVFEKKGAIVIWPPIRYSYRTIINQLPEPAPSKPSWLYTNQEQCAEYINGVDDVECNIGNWNWLGTDDKARDVMARVIYGFRISILFGLILTGASAIIGIAAGAIQGYFGGWIDLIAQRFIEIWSSTPQLYILLIIAAILPPGFWILLGIMLLFSWVGFVGIVRAEFLRARNFEYVNAARALGVGNRAIMFRHLLPNAMVATLTFLPFILNGSITTLTSLDFFCFFLPPGSPSLGELLSQGKNNLTSPWLGISGFMVISIMLSLLIFVGEAVRDAFDPRKTFS